MRSKYKYHGYLKSLATCPDPEALARVDQILFSGEELSTWKTQDDPTEKEWRDVPARIAKTDSGVTITGHFEDIRRIDNLDRNDSRYWAPLSLTSLEDPRFPLDCHRYPLVEITYRCLTSRACPACQWNYPGGAHLVHFEPCRDWVTTAILIPQRLFPDRLTRFSLRLYSAWRSTESVEIASVRFRGLLLEEEQALKTLEQDIDVVAPPRRYPILDEFLPFGVSMNAGTVEQLADLMDIPFFDYWRLALEDIARHHQNCVVVEGLQALDQDDYGVVVELAENFGLRLIPTFDWPMKRFEQEGEALIDAYIRPYTQSKAILAWNILDAPPEQSFQAFLRARDMIAAVDDQHPMALHMRQADAFPLFAPFFAVSGFSHFKTGDSTSIGNALRAHLPLAGGQQFWVTAPTFVYATNAPNWSGSPQLRLMLNMALANGARGWISHTYHNTPIWVDGHYQRSLTGPFLTFSDLWAELGNRVERLSVVAPLFLSAVPVDAPKHLNFETIGKKHPKSQLPEDAPVLFTFWLQGPDYYLYYVISNDTGQVTSVNMSIPETLPEGLEVYDTTALARTRAWNPSAHQRHLEMFPGQGQLFLIAKPPVCAHWREIIARRILKADQRQTRVDLELARQYKLDIGHVENTLNTIEGQTSIEGLNRVYEARNNLFDLIYHTPDIYEPRQLLIKASSIICGCDEALADLHGKGNTEIAHEMGIKMLPLARTLTALRIKLRRGRGAELRQDAAALVHQSTDYLKEIWNRR